ncbi:hypothetical protein Hanom_Chr07g00679901 [Helianthus anomalus]
MKKVRRFIFAGQHRIPFNSMGENPSLPLGVLKYPFTDGLKYLVHIASKVVYHVKLHLYPSLLLFIIVIDNRYNLKIRSNQIIYYYGSWLQSSFFLQSVKSHKTP